MGFIKRAKRKRWRQWERDATALHYGRPFHVWHRRFRVLRGAPTL